MQSVVIRRREIATLYDNLLSSILLDRILKGWMFQWLFVTVLQNKAIRGKRRFSRSSGLGFIFILSMASSQGWRLSLAAKRAKKRTRCLDQDCCRHSNLRCEHWRELKSYAVELCSCDSSQGDRVKTLKSLAALLLCLAAADDPANADGDYALSVAVGEAMVTIAHDDVVRLYKVLFQELAKISSYLLTNFWYVPEMVPCSSEAALHFEALAQTLCCCIRIIPIVDMFNTSMSHTAASTVHDMLHHLCSPSKFFPLGSPYTVKEHQDVVLRSALLEVFLDEILLHRALTFPEGEEFSYRASIEAAFAHMLHFQFLQDRPFQQSKLSLPAGVLLLDMSTNNQVPSDLLTHIISLVTGALVPGDLGTSCDAGSFAAIQAQNYIPHFQLDDELPHGVAIGLASSVVETAMGLLSKYYSAFAARDRDGFERGTQALSYVGGYNSDQGEYSSTLAALLRAMACAINRLVREVCTIKCQDRDGELIGVRDLAIQRTFETVATAIRFNMPSTKFMHAIGCFNLNMVEALTSENARGTIGWTLVIFAHIFSYESLRGLDEAVAVEYVRVLDSLLALLLLESRPDNGVMDDEVPASTNFFLREMIKSLHQTAWDMCSRKKSATKLLSFISKVTPIGRKDLPTIEAVDWLSPGISFDAGKDLPTIETVTPDISVHETIQEVVQEVVQEVIVEEASDSTTPLKPRPSTLIIAKRFKLKKLRVEQLTDTPVERTSAPDDTPVESKTKKRRRRGAGMKNWSAEACISKRTRSATKSKSPAATVSSSNKNRHVENPFVAEMLTRETYEESFADLNDFIVCKKGRNYTRFLNARIKYRRKSHTRMIWKRRDERQSLMKLLELCGERP
ncbi:uncharacterized protein LOC9631564 [Selaginella moellendorffii]|uniref:uncharacterized protein LOC9631564 n=1 Tax=Selaginella moellendorffii TaxID=88036 RepID=UPI000D1C5F41|nr:uncharacterized protein LOC9631564 [Selaginella moellendorffii]XP_024520077.1 uncharacterized protein LOC9631564 [Selaginella moellendorffii]XP_024520078.1 uncharacterized protein LOC9631564 [Selaginella moellendorffii]|eukprot:XP_002990517.2 uncharacterized protein LOC9631564 [Selaginella moellendorffii]